MSKLPKSHRKPFSGYSNSKKVSFARSTFGVISFVSRSFKRIALSLICLVGAIGFSTISPSGASTGTTSSNTILYAAASSTGIGNCADANDACDLATALTKVTAGETIDLVTPGSTNSYEGNFTLNTNGTSLTAPITIQPAPGVTNPTLYGNNSGTVLTINTNVYVNLIGVTITGGQAASGSYGTQGPGGRGGNGGGINYSGSGSLTITDSTISGNSAGNGGNGLSSGGAGGNGGGISYVGTGSLTITDSTISGNSAGTGGNGTFASAGTGGNGGGIYYHSSGSFTISNATITGNGAGNAGTNTTPGLSGDGGGIYNNGGTTTISNSTISGNSVLGGGASGLGSGIYNASGTVNLAADLLATPSAPSTGGECSGGGFIDYGYNVADDNTCGLHKSSDYFPPSTNKASSPGLLSSLQNNGGSTLTILPGHTNPAIGLIPPTATVTIDNTKLSLCPTTDQRGFATVSGVYCDAGSLQLASVLYAAATPIGSATCADATDACNLTTALGDVGAGGTIDLVTSGSSSITSTNSYEGNFTLNTANTSATTPVTIQPAPGVTNPTLDGQGKGTVLTINSNFVNLNGVTVTGGQGGQGGQGGGIFSSGTLTVTNSTFFNNSAISGYGGQGGAIANDGALTVTNSTFFNNTAGGQNGGQGGGIFYSGTLTVANSTFFNNIAGGQGDQGGGIYGNGGTLTVTNSTFFNNISADAAAIFSGDAATYLAADLLATKGGAPSGGECGGYGTTITDLGYIVADDNTCGFPSSPTANKSTSIVSIASENLGPLQNNGGPTQTILPEPGNPAIGLIPTKTAVTIGTNGPSITLCPTTDQRGISATGPYCNAGSVQQTPRVITTTFPYPAPPQLNNPTPISPTSITLSWSQSTNQSYLPATGYNIFEGTTSGKESTTPISCTTPLTASSTSCTVTNLNPSTTYYFYIEATNTSGSSLPSNEVSITTLTTNQSPSTQNPSTTTKPGYYVVAKDGGVFSYGSATFYGSLANKNLNQPIVGIASTLDGKGYWLVASDGGVFSYGSATFYGSLANKNLNQPIVGIASTPDGKGYWLVASDGGVFSFGDAVFYGSLPPKTLNKPIVGIASTPDGKGYWLVASDGGVFSFGDAVFYGSLPPKTLNKPIVGIASTPDGKGYWLVASDGGVFSFGDAVFYGSLPPKTLNKPIVGIASTPDGKGYWLVASDGGVFSFGDAAFYGSLPPKKLNEPIDAITVG
ncbi:fibronectin type III domain-containing protein [Acidithrix sp. C25]|uniref:beta strand repeat-containing protein n=1 Tax=Acidithrix sp. C25 TaxID=1671482 RepID=UPI00191BC763|nr:fibronectin type III domain-containing protein [Acidithrix sp. C25]CAG4930671.1 unnamed protein product [Acidithrix sp. C25]